MQYARIRKSFLLFLFYPWLLTAEANIENLRWYYPVDLWAYQPQFELESYNAYKLHEKIPFYEDQKLTGDPSFEVVLDFVTYKDGESCRLANITETKKVTNWLACTPYRCTPKSSSESQEVVVVNPLKLEWRKSRELSKKCSRQLEVKIGRFKIDNAISTYLFFHTKSDQTVSLEGKKYYGRFPTCDSNAKCFLSQDNKNGIGSFNKRLEEVRKKPPVSEISQISTCRNLSGTKQIECLNEHTYKEDETSVFRDDIPYTSLRWGYRFEPVSWTKENIAEINACIDQTHGLDRGMFKGIKKKCFFIGTRIAVIDYPEAFLEESEMIDSRVYNIELEK